jgi:hypothetical protein
LINGSHIKTHILPLFDKPGTFLEIGCWQGTHYSQSKELEDRGWTGICVDPFPYLFEGRKCKVIAKAVSKDGKPREFVKVFQDRRHGGDVSYFSGFKDSISFHWPLIEEHCDYVHAPVETIRFEDIGTPLHTNFLSVDVEGAEFEILSSIDYDKYSFDAIMYEHNGIDNGVKDLLRSKGYYLYRRLEIDNIFVKDITKL